MNIKLMRLKLYIYKKLRIIEDIFIIPFFKIMDKLVDMKHDRFKCKMKRKCISLSDEELMQRYAKYVVKSLIKKKNGNPRSNPERNYMIYNKETQDCQDYKASEHIKKYTNSNNGILYDLLFMRANSQYKDDVLKYWWIFKETELLNSKDNLAHYEKRLNILLKQKLNDLGVYAEYKDIREGKYKDKYAKDAFYCGWLGKIGYEKSLIVRLN